jgi:transglutaminase-like putative cysteine protease
MKRIIPKLLLAVNLLTFCKTEAQHRAPIAGKEPAWVTINTIDYTNNSLDKEAEDGYADLNFEKQTSLADRCVYIRKSIKILSEAGVQNESQISVSFDPSYQQLIFHTVHIIRNGEVINHLQLSKVKTIQQETDLDNFIYNGSLNAVMFLEDVRKGDIIEYSYSLKGFNPIFNGKYSEVYSTQYSCPVYNLYYKLIVPNRRTINIKYNIDTLSPVVKTSAAETVYEWKRSNVNALHTQDYLPSWYDPYPDIMVSEYKSWKEVNDWARAIFPNHIQLSLELQKMIREIQNNNSSPESRVQAALRFVQDDIRYMGIEMGIHSHKPANPNKVFAQRFGDCKEKSYLLCCMLNAMGIDANPVLINTVDKRALIDRLPSPTDFNHTTVRVKLNDAYYWFDPTISYQRGNIGNISYPDYQWGFVISDTTTSLTTIPFHETGRVNVKEMFTIPDMYGKARLIVTTHYNGSYADNVRNDFKNNSNYEMQKSYQQFYAGYFDRIKTDSLLYADNDSTGLFITTEYYSIDSFWSVNNGIKKVSFSPFVIQSVIQKPQDQQRTMPFYIPFPAKYHEEIEINLPEEWDAKQSSKKIACADFILNTKFSSSYKKILLQYEFENLKDYVMPGEANKFFASLKKSNEEQGYELTYNEKRNNTDALKNTSSKAMYIFLGVLLLTGGIVRWTQRR